MSMKYLNWMYANIPYKYLQPGEQSVLTALAIRYNDSPEKKDDTPSCYPSMAMLKRMTQLSESGINKIKVSLRRLGFVKWKSGGRAGEKRTSNEYVLLYPNVKGTTRPIFSQDSIELEARRHRRKDKPETSVKTKPQEVPQAAGREEVDHVESALEKQCLQQIHDIFAKQGNTNVFLTLKRIYEFLRRHKALNSQILAVFNDVTSHIHAVDACYDAIDRVVMQEGSFVHIANPFNYLRTAIRNAILQYEQDHGKDPWDAQWAPDSAPFGLGAGPSSPVDSAP